MFIWEGKSGYQRSLEMFIAADNFPYFRGGKIKHEAEAGRTLRVEISLFLIVGQEDAKKWKWCFSQKQEDNKKGNFLNSLDMLLNIPFSKIAEDNCSSLNKLGSLLIFIEGTYNHNGVQNFCH